jgi:HAD superfamily hydrolase (TIGR01662 family)
MSKEIVIIMGFPASGKSTTVQQFVDQGYNRLNRDKIGGSIEEIASKTDMLLLRDPKPVVVDNLYPTIKSRASLIAVAKKHKIPIRCYVMSTTLEDAQMNACLRMMKKHGVIPNPEDFKTFKDPNTFPPAVIYKYRKEFQPPTTSEGFDQVIKVPFVRVWGPEYVNKAVICDYDGTLRLCNDGAKFPVTPNQIKVLPNRLETLRRYRDDGYSIFGASNQSGVAKGDLTAEEAHVCFQHTNRLLGDLVTKYLFCPHSVPPINCYCRKPTPGMGAYFIETYKLLPSKCIMVGDMGSDKSFAARCGFQYVDANDFFKQ